MECCVVLDLLLVGQPTLQSLLTLLYLLITPSPKSGKLSLSPARRRGRFHRLAGAGLLKIESSRYVMCCLCVVCVVETERQRQR